MAGNVYDSEGIAPTLVSGMSHGNVMPYVVELNPNGKHQQDLLMHTDGICRCICVGCHGSTPHLLKIVEVKDGR